MENLKCPSCGNENPAGFSNCQYCGEMLTAEAYEPENYEVPRARNGFTTFYLWWGLVVNALFTLAYFATIFTKKGLWSAYDPMSERIFGFVSSAILVFGYLSLIKWKKYGFYILIVMGIITLISNFFIGASIGVATFSPIVSMLILYAVLQIKKNGVSCWEHLS